MAITKVLPIEDESHFDKYTTALPPTTLQIRYFHAPWAAPCTQMSAVLDALAGTYPAQDPPTISFQSLNAEDLPEISEAHNVTAVPFVVLVRGGLTLEEVSGGDAAKVRGAVERHHKPEGKTNGAALPPVQKVTRPAEQPAPASAPQSNAKPTNTTTASAPKDTNTPQTTTSPTNGTTPTEPQDLHTRLTQLTTAAPVMLFLKGTPSAPQCGFSRQLVSILREHSVRYGFFNILADDDVRQGLKEFADWPTFPQLWMGGELVGGLDVVREEVDNDSGFFGGVSVGREGQAAAT